MSKKTRKLSFVILMLAWMGLIQYSVKADVPFVEFCMNNIEDAKCSNYKTLRSSQASMDEIRNNIDAFGVELNTYHQTLIQMNTQLEDTKSEIVTLEEDIAAIASDITHKEDAVAAKRNEMAKYMIQSQSRMRVNGYIEFLMNAENFVDIFRRIDGLTRIQRVNENTVNTYRSIIVSLNETKEAFNLKQQELINKQDILTLQINETEIMKENVHRIIEELMIQKQDMMKEIEIIQEKVAIDNQNFYLEPDIIARPLKTDYWVSAGVWQYPSGGTHVGIDLAPITGNVGMNLLAPGNGIVVAMRGGCETWGWYGSSCNGGYGNYINMIVSDGKTSYGILYAHLVKGSFRVKVGDSVRVGDVIGQVGSSGSSTGPHVHAEVYNLGPISIKEAYDAWNGSNTFGTGSASSNGLSYLCSVRGAPCRENPQEIWNYEYGQIY